MSLSLGIDTGGTYTDAVLYDPERGVIAAAKALTTRHDLAEGVGAAIAGVLPADGAGKVRLVSLSTTLATNALVEGQGSPAALLLIGYDQGALGRAGLGAALKGDPVAFIRGGHGALGDEQEPLDLEAARRVDRGAGVVGAAPGRPEAIQAGSATLRGRPARFGLAASGAGSGAAAFRRC